MNKSAPPSSSPGQGREQRLAAKLRENLRRRKAQERAQTAPAPDKAPQTRAIPPLPKSPPES